MDWIHYHKNITGSTNEDAYQIGIDGGRTWTVCTADGQTNGRGRMDRKWYSPSGCGLYISVLIRPNISPDEAGLLSICAANAMNGSLRNSGIPAMIKWPNDIVLNRKKVCGILSSCNMKDKKIDFCVIGAGVNLLSGAFPRELSKQATSLEEEGYPFDREVLINEYIRQLQNEVEKLERKETKCCIEKYVSFCVTLGSRITVTGSEEMIGYAETVNEKGELILRDDQNNMHIVRCGDVSVRGIMGYV